MIKFSDKGSLRRKDFLLVTGQEFCPLWWGGKVPGGRSDGCITWFPRSGKLVQGWLTLLSILSPFIQSAQGLTGKRGCPPWASLLTSTETLGSPPTDRASCLSVSWVIERMTLHLIISASALMVQTHLIRRWMTKNNVSGRPESVSRLVSDRAGLKRRMSWKTQRPALFSQSAPHPSPFLLVGSPFLLVGFLSICHPLLFPAEVEWSWKTNYWFFFLLT